MSGCPGCIIRGQPHVDGCRGGRINKINKGTVERPVYRKVLYKGPPEHATKLYQIHCDEGWRISIVCEGMYEWAADWLLEEIQGKRFAPKARP